jgi:tetratricopeptide (TPR) repeat protein
MDVEELIKAADELRRMGKYEEALTIYGKVLEKCPKNVPALIGKGVALRGLKIYDEALKHLIKPLKLVLSQLRN